MTDELHTLLSTPIPTFMLDVESLKVVGQVYPFSHDWFARFNAG